MATKIGFWAVLALVTGSQIGSGIFVQPSTLAPFGSFALLGWLISGTGATALALVFGWLCAQFPKTGGPAVYIEEAFGRTCGFFAGWTYWVVSCVSMPVLYVAVIGYLSPIFGTPSPAGAFSGELILFILLTWLNLRGVHASGRAEFILTLLKVLPLIILPLCALFNFNSYNITTDQSKIAGMDLSDLLASVAMLTLWGFIGIETATTAAGAVENPKKSIPRAIFLGTLAVAAIYFFNSLAIMGTLPGTTLASSNAPYAEAAQLLFGGHWSLVISLMAAIACLGTANAWTLSSGQVALGLAESRMLPKMFTQKNAHGAPVWGLLASAIPILPILFLTTNQGMIAQINMIIDFSVTAFLFIYLAVVLSFFKIHWKERTRMPKNRMLTAIIALFFCGWVIGESSFSSVAIASLFFLSGLPMFWLMKRWARHVSSSNLLGDADKMRSPRPEVYGIDSLPPRV